MEGEELCDYAVMEKKTDYKRKKQMKKQTLQTVQYIVNILITDKIELSFLYHLYFVTNSLTNYMSCLF